MHSHSSTITDIAYSTINGLLLATSGWVSLVELLIVLYLTCSFLFLGVLIVLIACYMFLMHITLLSELLEIQLFLKKNHCLHFQFASSLNHD